MTTTNYSLFTGYDASAGGSTVAFPANAAQFNNFNIQSSVYGFDDNDATLTIQGSIDGLAWNAVGSALTLPQPTTFAVVSYTSANSITVTGDCTAQLAANPVFYTDGATTPGNDGIKTSTNAVFGGVNTVITISETVVVEAGAGDAWTAQQSSLLIPEADTYWNQYRIVFAPVSVAAGFMDVKGISKSY